jgi:hypothetical protein
VPGASASHTDWPTIRDHILRSLDVLVADRKTSR